MVSCQHSRMHLCLRHTAQRHTGAQHEGTQSHGHTVTQAHSHTGTQSHIHTVTQAHRHTVTQSHTQSHDHMCSTCAFLCAYRIHVSHMPVCLQSVVCYYGLTLAMLLLIK